jgi:uncharacterized protein YyaL (SSP411 family)
MKTALIPALVVLLGLPLKMSADEATAGETGKHKFTNRLAKEKSPYLLQHQHNPVDWYPWGEEAFAKAKKENKLVFLSIGYSTCHWCHVMERESFEDPKIGKFLNDHFVSIKLDREERPDIDKIYMRSMQAMEMGGGWPLNVFMTSDRKPFFGGTYWGPNPSPRGPSFTQVLEHISGLWTTKQKEIEANASDITAKLGEFFEQSAAAKLPVNLTLIGTTAKQIMGQYDPINGGFSGAPKFPQPPIPSLVLYHGVTGGDQRAVDMALDTCRKMAEGGIYDQLGGGFARYSVDEKWLVPHFEKMLYDNAQLVDLYLDAYLVNGDDYFANVVRDVLRYVLRDMTHKDGGFYSAEDADSEGKEGKFYCWTKKELEKLLTAEEAALVIGYYGVTEKGNFHDHSDPDALPDQNVLSIVDGERKLSAAEKALLGAGKEKMLAYRAKRVRPGLDDKVLANWNGMMLGAIARAGIVLNDQTYLAAARKNFAFLKDKLWDAKTKTLYHRWRDGERDTAQIHDSYANVLAGVIDLYEATLDPQYLEFAIELNASMLKNFYDEKDGGFYESAGNDDVIFRLKSDNDGAEPSGNSVAIGAMLKLAATTHDDALKAKAEKSVQLFADSLTKTGQALPLMLQHLPTLLGEPVRVVITGDPNSAEGKALIRAAHRAYRPDKVVLGNVGPVEEFATTLKDVKGKPAAYVCTGTLCKNPTQDAATVKGYVEIITEK